MHIPKTRTDASNTKITLFLWSALVIICLVALWMATSLVSVVFSLTVFVILLSVIMTTQSLLTIIWMLYAWEDASYAKKHRSPETYLTPQFSFTALIPARHETGVIADTIRAVSNIRYPESLKEIIVLCRSDDVSTIQKAKETIEKLPGKNIRVAVFSSDPINKPHSLNIGLRIAQNDVIAVFDAEDEPHPDIFSITNTIMLRDDADVVQCGVQLMNYQSKWFCGQSVLEYFFWFKSGLHFFSRVGGVAPLGGNTVFMKKSYLTAVEGWDESCLTEDAEVGFRLVQAGAKIRVVYDERHTTREESPIKIAHLIKQRTRWDQGFLQVLVKGEWLHLPKLSQRLMVLYILLSPVVHGLMLFYVPFALWVAFTQQLPLIVTLFSYMPLVLFIGQMLVFGVGMYEFTRAYNLPCTPKIIAGTFIGFLPYQCILMFSSMRAFFRFVFRKNGWEKTLHTNEHRTSDLSLASTSL